MSSVVLMVLACGHVVAGKPRPPYRPMCITCGERRRLKDVLVKEWRNRCYDCSHTIWTGMDEHRARRNTVVHNRNRPDHRMFAEFAVRPASKSVRDYLLRQGVISVVE